MNYFFKEESFKQAHAEMMPLFHKHYLEIAKYQDIPLSPALESYYRLEDLGILKTYIVRDENKVIRGYAIYFVKENLHYSTSLQANQDVLFIDPEHRGFGSKFIDWCDGQLKRLGVQVAVHHVKAEHNFGPLLEKKGYELMDLIYTKRLD